jgi:triosephosphate isomerase
MSTPLPPLFLANWKMNMLEAEVDRFATSFLQKFSALADGRADVGIAPPLTALAATRRNFENVVGLMIGSQNVHWLETGAHTGEVSAPMLLEQGVHFSIIGHSERRQFYGESNETVSMRAQAALAHRLCAVVCVGESKADFQSGNGPSVVKEQLYGSLGEISLDEQSQLVVAYEPVWAIGTGLAASPEVAAEMHTMIRAELVKLFGADLGQNIRILYGGSTKPDNIASLMSQENINGALIGGASLLPESFSSLVEIGRKANSI